MWKLANAVCLIWIPTLVYTIIKALKDKLNEKEIANCKCHNKGTCRIPISFHTKGIIYQANIDYDIPGYKQNCYLGSIQFWESFRESFNHIKYRNDMELSKSFWEIKKPNGTPKIIRKIIRICSSPIPNSKRCLYVLTRNTKLQLTKRITFWIKELKQ